MPTGLLDEEQNLLVGYKEGCGGQLSTSEVEQQKGETKNAYIQVTDVLKKSNNTHMSNYPPVMVRLPNTSTTKLQLKKKTNPQTDHSYSPWQAGYRSLLFCE